MCRPFSSGHVLMDGKQMRINGMHQLFAFKSTQTINATVNNIITTWRFTYYLLLFLVQDGICHNAVI